MASGCEREQPCRHDHFNGSIEALVDLQPRESMIIKPCAAKSSVVECEAQGRNEMQSSTRVGAEANDVAGVRRYFGLIENNVHGNGSSATARRLTLGAVDMVY
jgi:hypothetical protein